VQWTVGSGGNDHWYEFIATNLVAQDAFVAAGAATFMGMSGYLATVTSADENRFVSASVAQGALAWLGGSDSGSEGNWVWMVGPEAGQAFSFAAWGGGEPNDVGGGEDFIHTNWCGTGCWNDHGGPGSGGSQANGYIIEYSAKPNNVPEPMTLALVLPALLAAAALGRRRAG
jgi:hypothetical protein